VLFCAVQIVVPAQVDGPVGSGSVFIYAANGTLINIIGQAISYPWTCAVTSSGLIVVDSSSQPGVIYLFNATTGSYTSFTYAALGTDFEALGMAVADDGRIFVASVNLGIYVFSSTGQYLDVISSPQEDIYAYSMAYTTSGGGLLYVADLFNQRVVTFKVGGVASLSSSSSSSTGSSMSSSSGGSLGPASSSSRTVGGLAAPALLTVAALIAALLNSA